MLIYEALHHELEAQQGSQARAGEPACGTLPPVHGDTVDLEPAKQNKTSKLLSKPAVFHSRHKVTRIIPQCPTAQLPVCIPE